MKPSVPTFCLIALCYSIADSLRTRREGFVKSARCWAASARFWATEYRYYNLTKTHA